MITVNNLVHHEFIGLSVSVTSVSNESLRLKGTVIDETKNTIKTVSYTHLTLPTT